MQWIYESPDYHFKRNPGGGHTLYAITYTSENGSFRSKKVWQSHDYKMAEEIQNKLKEMNCEPSDFEFMQDMKTAIS